MLISRRMIHGDAQLDQPVTKGEARTESDRVTEH
jgi:hypothetical protein